MPNPTSKLNLVINGATTQLDIHDSNAVDLTSNQTVAGNKEFTGTTTAHDLVPSATDTYNFGSSTAQWNNAYIKSLTINGVACGDILTHNANEFVGVSGAQTIAGNKTFSGTVEFTSSPMVKRTSDPFYSLTTTVYDKGTNPSSNLYSGVRFFSNPNDTAQNKITGGLDMVYYASGYNAIGLNARNYDENSNHRFFTVALRVSNDSTIPADFVPSVNALINLGSSTTYWKDCYTKAINGVNPGALSLPSTATGYVDIKSTVGQYLKDNNTNIYEFTAPFDGWVCVGIIRGSLRIDNSTTNISSGSENLGYWYCCTIPFMKNNSIAIKINKMDPADDYVNDIMWKAYIYPCQGNV